jgi:hypothetical protein
MGTTWTAAARRVNGHQGDRGIYSVVPALIASLFWAHSFVLGKLTGRLSSDEIYFCHTFWLMGHGLRQYYDFYSTHLPAYFYLLLPLIQVRDPTSLTFIWVLRFLAIPALVAYALMLWAIERRNFVVLLPILLSFIVLARMTEIRTDTPGLLLVNVGWCLLLRDREDRRIWAAAAISSFAILFSARAAIVVPLLFACCGMLAIWRRRYDLLLCLAGIAALWAMFVAVAYLRDHDFFVRMMKSVYFDTSIDPTVSMPKVSLKERALAPDRLYLLSFIVLALAAGLRTAFRDPANQFAYIVVTACLGQIVLILADPAPFGYVYGWSLLPTLFGIALLSHSVGHYFRPALAALALSSVPGLWLISATSLRLLGVSPPHTTQFQNWRLVHDHPLGADLQRLKTTELIRVMVTEKEGSSLHDELIVRQEVCRRVPGTVVSRFDDNPICMRDGYFDWIGQTWPVVAARCSRPTNDWTCIDKVPAQHRDKFARAFRMSRPTLFIWGQRGGPNDWAKSLLTDYDVYDAYAVRHIGQPNGGIQVLP